MESLNIRNLGLFVLLWILISFSYNMFSDSRPWFLIDNVNLIFHEAGHIFMSFLGTFLMILGGTIFEISIPLIVTFYFLAKKRPAGMMFGLWWLSSALYGISIYSRDSRAQILPLLGGDNVTHDWFYLLSKLGILKYDQVVGNFFIFLSILSILLILFVACRSILLKNILKYKNKSSI